MGAVYRIAAKYAIGEKTDTGYLYKFPNNIGITIVLGIIFRLSAIIKITNFSTVATTFNAIIVGLSGVMMYIIAKKIFGNKSAIMVLVITLFTTPFYLYSAIYYTDTLSLFMMLLMVYVYLLIQRLKKAKIFGFIILGILTFVAIKIKITTSFIVIAYVLYRILTGDIKNICKELIYIIPTILICMIIYNNIINNVILTDKELSDNLKIPIEHWIMMGLYENGGYNVEDYKYTNQYATYQEKREATISKIKERLSSYNSNSFIKHINSKLKYGLTDGTYFAPEKLRREPVNENILHKFILSSGEYSKYYKYLPQVMHFSMLILILIGIVHIIKFKEYTDINIIFYILIFGFILFLLIWENRSRYILTAVPFMIISQLKGLEILSKKIKERGERI